MYFFCLVLQKKSSLFFTARFVSRQLFFYPFRISSPWCVAPSVRMSHQKSAVSCVTCVTHRVSCCFFYGQFENPIDNVQIFAVWFLLELIADFPLVAGSLGFAVQHFLIEAFSRVFSWRAWAWHRLCLSRDCDLSRELRAWMFFTEDLHLLLIKMWSIWLCVILSLECHVTICDRLFSESCAGGNNVLKAGECKQSLPVIVPFSRRELSVAIFGVNWLAFSVGDPSNNDNCVLTNFLYGVPQSVIEVIFNFCAGSISGSICKVSYDKAWCRFGWQ